jgi:Flp pilus assembly pilin Flp
MTAFLRNEEGQDLIEYTLLLAFVALVAAGLFISSGQSTSGIWSIANTQLSSASAAAAS